MTNDCNDIFDFIAKSLTNQNELEASNVICIITAITLFQLMMTSVRRSLLFRCCATFRYFVLQFRTPYAARRF